MTIAACYPSAEGVVLGADSTSTTWVSAPGHRGPSIHHYNFCQKIFEFGGPGATAGVVLWGMGSFGKKSYRTIIAETSDEVAKRDVISLGDVAQLSVSMFWSHYTSEFGQQLARARALDAKGSGRTPEETSELEAYTQSLSGGFCIAGRWGSDRTSHAYQMLFDPLQLATPLPTELNSGWAKFWGCPNLVERLIYGMDEGLWTRILASGKWAGTSDELFELVREGSLSQPYDLPLREAIDLVYASVYTTIKAMKFSHLAPVCGGPIEIAVISSDRPFRWVRHKRLGEALADHQTREERL